MPEPPRNRDQNPSATTRRLFLKGSAIAALVTAGPRFAAHAATKTTKKKAVATTKKTTTTTAKPATTTTAAKTAAAATAGGATFTAAQELAVTFTFAADSGRRARNPYVAVWIEDGAGSLVRTIDLSIQLGKGLKWLPDLRRWFRADQDRLDLGGADVVQTMSTATRLPGSYTVTWDGKDELQALVPLGGYFICIEGARENGPYELIREAITIGTTAFTKELPPNGELTAASVELRAKR